MRAAVTVVLTTVLTAGAFPPFDWGYLAFFALVPLFLYCEGKEGGRVFFAGWLGGWAASTAVVWWVVNTIIHYGGLSWSLAVPILLLIDPVLAPVPSLLLAVPLTAWQLLRERGTVDRSGVIWILVGRIPGGLLGP